MLSTTTLVVTEITVKKRNFVNTHNYKVKNMGVAFSFSLVYASSQIDKKSSLIVSELKGMYSCCGVFAPRERIIESSYNTLTSVLPDM